jgi:small redox-active disulfide protein 2
LQFSTKHAFERKGNFRVKEIKVLGPGCAKCTDLAKNAEAAAKAVGVEYTLTKVTDLQQIMAFGVMMTPALVVDGEVKIVGKVASAEEIKQHLS